MFTTKDVNRQRVREQDYQEARNDFNKSARHDLMVKNMQAQLLMLMYQKCPKVRWLF